MICCHAVLMYAVLIWNCTQNCASSNCNRACVDHQRMAGARSQQRCAVGARALAWKRLDACAGSLPTRSQGGADNSLQMQVALDGVGRNQCWPFKSGKVRSQGAQVCGCAPSRVWRAAAAPPASQVLLRPPDKHGVSPPASLGCEGVAQCWVFWGGCILRNVALLLVAYCGAAQHAPQYVVWSGSARLTDPLRGPWALRGLALAPHLSAPRDTKGIRPLPAAR